MLHLLIYIFVTFVSECLSSNNVYIAIAGKKSALSEDDDLPEVDQATKKNLRSRPSAKLK